MATTVANSFVVLVFAAAMVMACTFAGAEGRCIDDESDLGMYWKDSLMHPDSPKTPPSGRCCDAVRQIDIPCLCSFVDENYEKGVSMEKLVYVMDACDKPLRPGCKCGITLSHHYHQLVRANKRWIAE